MHKLHARFLSIFTTRIRQLKGGYVIGIEEIFLTMLKRPFFGGGRIVHWAGVKYPSCIGVFVEPAVCAAVSPSVVRKLNEIALEPRTEAICQQRGGLVAGIARNNVSLPLQSHCEHRGCGIRSVGNRVEGHQILKGEDKLKLGVSEAVFLSGPCMKHGSTGLLNHTRPPFKIALISGIERGIADLLLWEVLNNALDPEILHQLFPVTHLEEAADVVTMEVAEYPAGYGDRLAAVQFKKAVVNVLICAVSARIDDDELAVVELYGIRHKPSFLEQKHHHSPHS